MLLVAMLAFVALPFANQSHAQGRSLPLVRDAEIENLLNDYTAPIFRAAGLRSGSIEIFLLNQQEFNAFVTGTRMFINTGAIMQADTPNEIIGVFAHETGHILGGHLTRLRDRLEQAQILSLLGLLAGAGAAVAGGGGDAAAAIALGTGSAARRGLLAYQREEESSADRAGLTLLEKTGQSGRGMLTTFKKLGQNPLFSSGRLDPYALSHPLPRERIAFLQDSAARSPFFDKKDPEALQLRHDLARAKIAAYAGGFNLVRNLFGKDFNSMPGLYGSAIAYHLSGIPRQGLPIMDRLIKQQPKNPYFHEMKGEILLKAGRPADAAKSFKQAIALDRSESGLLRVQLGHALLETGNSANLKAAIQTLKGAVGRDKYSSRAHGLLARAHAASGDQILAMAATAEERFIQGRIREAKQFALRAQPHIKTGSPTWLRLEDIIKFSK